MTEVAIGESEVEGRYRVRGEETEFETTRPPDVEHADPLATLARRDVEVTGSTPGVLPALLLSWLVPIALIALVWVFLIRRLARGV